MKITGEKNHQPQKVSMKLLLCFDSLVENATRCRTIDKKG